MRTAIVAALLVLVSPLVGCGDKKSDPVTPSEPQEASTPLNITSVRWDNRKDDGTGDLYALDSRGGEQLVASGAIDSWFSGDQKTLYYTYRHGKSGYEREGMGLKRFHVETGESETVFDHDLMILYVRESTTKSGKLLLVVDMIDGGLGAPEIAVADPDKGRIFVYENARIMNLENGVLTVGHLTMAQIESADFYDLPEPEKTEDVDLDSLVSKPASRETPDPLPED